jgi:hypothetical protein
MSRCRHRCRCCHCCRAAAKLPPTSRCRAAATAAASTLLPPRCRCCAVCSRRALRCRHRQRRWRRRRHATMKFIPYLPSQLQLEMCWRRQAACHLAGVGLGGIGVICNWFIEPPLRALRCHHHRRRLRRRRQATMKFIPHLPSQLQLEMSLDASQPAT